MTDLENLKQQLYAKIQKNSEQEKPLTDADLVKHSELPTYQAHQNLRQQTFEQWQHCPIQGAIPKPLSELDEVEAALKTALPWLEQAYCLMNSNRLDKRYAELYVAVCDAMTATQEACDRINDAPDMCGLATLGQPINSKVHPPQSAFEI